MVDRDRRLRQPKRPRDAIAEIRFRPLSERDLDRVLPEPIRQLAVEWLRRQERGEVYVAVAEVGAKPLGRAGLDFVTSGKGIARLWAAHVEPEHQSRGIGSRLLRHLEEVAVGEGCTSIELAVAKENRRAKALYERLGYAVCGEAVEPWSYRDGAKLVQVVEDCWLMRKELAP